MSGFQCTCSNQPCSCLENGLWDESSHQGKEICAEPWARAQDGGISSRFSSLREAVPRMRVISRILPWTVCSEGPERDCELQSDPRLLQLLQWDPLPLSEGMPLPPRMDTLVYIFIEIWAHSDIKILHFWQQCLQQKRNSCHSKIPFLVHPKTKTKIM